APPPAWLGPQMALEDEVPRLGALHQFDPGAAGRWRRGGAGRDHGGRRRLHHGAGDDLSAGHADQGGHRHLAVSDHLFVGLYHADARRVLEHGGRDAGGAADRRRRDRGADRHPSRRKAAGRAVAHPAGAFGAGGLRQAGAGPVPAPGRTLLDHAGGSAMIRGALVLLAALVLPGLPLHAQSAPEPAAAQPAEQIVAGLSREDVEITTSFDGSEIIIYGAIKRETAIPPDEALDVIVTLEGP